MIHSLAGGTIKNIKYADFAKVQILDGIFSGDILWYITDFAIKEGSIVVVPVGRNNMLVKGKVLRVDSNISGQVAPVPINRAKKIERIITK